MFSKLWEEMRLPPSTADDVWELFHENSKVGRYSNMSSDEAILAQLDEYHASLPFEGYPVVALPHTLTPLPLSLEQALTARASVRSMAPCPLPLENLATLLYYAYGVTRDNQGTARAFRVVPSGGALYPLEIFFHSAHVVHLPAGLYHYNPTTHTLRCLRAGDDTLQIPQAVLQPHVVREASVMIFITALFERSIFKYGNRGYRFIMLEAGHVAQNINLVALSLGLGCLNIGGFFDRQVDELLGLNGLAHSTLYMIAAGKHMPGPQDVAEPG